jgi:hypothetical protein
LTTRGAIGHSNDKSHEKIVNVTEAELTITIATEPSQATTVASSNANDGSDIGARSGGCT